MGLLAIPYKTKYDELKLSRIIVTLQALMDSIGDCNVYFDACGDYTSDSEFYYGKDVFGYNCERGEEMYHTGLFINCGFKFGDNGSDDI
ncbi:MAG TPA: hypothetical protein VFG24_03530 [Nitrosopumilaceae archaeon]|nr:hypothetical protein [Nitrosopumilaceae archaeon]